MSYNSQVDSRSTIQNRKISMNLLQTHTRDSSEQATSSKSIQSHWGKDAESISTEAESQLALQNTPHLLSLHIYNATLRVDCSDACSLQRFMRELHRNDSIKMETKMALSLIVAQKAHQLNLNCADFMKNVLDSYQTLHLQQIFN